MEVKSLEHVVLCVTTIGVQRSGFPGRLRNELSFMQGGDCFCCG